MSVPAATASAGVAVVSGMVIAESRLGAVCLAVAVLSLLLISLRDRLRGVFLITLGVLLVGYAFLSRGFAYVGRAPLRIGEAVLLIAVLALVVFAWRRRFPVLSLLIVAFVAWGVIRTVPYLSFDGSAALRDGVVWGYATFALAIVAAARPVDLRRAFSLYGKVLPWFLAWVPIAYLLTMLNPALIPHAPGSAVPLLVFKSGDMAVHLAGAAGFMLIGPLALRRVPTGFQRLACWTLWWIGFGIIAVLSRGGFLAIVVALAVALSLRPSIRWRPLVAGLAVAVVFVTFLQPSLSTANGRTTSVHQVITNAKSVVASSGTSGRLQGTKEYRLRWWRQIVSYTFSGPYFWMGKGFGVNLADVDGFQVKADHSLRAPHNTHFTILARMGVPGFLVWIAIQLGLAGSLVRARRVALSTREHFWAQVNGWLLVYWTAMMVNTSFDPYLEGPQGGIWFWSLVGISLAALRAQHAPREAKGLGAKEQ